MQFRPYALSYLLGAILAGGRCAQAAGAPSAPTATTTASSKPATQGIAAPLRITIVQVKGIVQFRNQETEPWQAAKVGIELAEGAEFRTGPRSSVRCEIPPDQSFTLDRLGIVKVAQAIRQGNKTKTDLEMKYGRTEYTIEGAGPEHESTISSPGGALVVRGTQVSLYDQPPFVPEAISYTGRARFRDVHREIAFGGKGAGKQTLAADKDSAADTALANSVIDPKFAAARTAAEDSFIASEVARGGRVSFDPLANITVITGGMPITKDTQLVQTLPAGLTFVARWDGPADVNLEVFHESGDPLALLFSGKTFEPTEFLYPGFGLNVVPSGGLIPFDHRGGPHGGTEFAFWAGLAPQGVYGVAALFISGVPVTVRLNVFLNGQKQTIFTTDAQGNLSQTTDYQTKLSSGTTPGGPLVLIPNPFATPPAPTNTHAKAAESRKAPATPASGETAARNGAAAPAAHRR